VTDGEFFVDPADVGPAPERAADDVETLSPAEKAVLAERLAELAAKAARPKMLVPGPGLYLDLAVEDYHADPVLGGSLSSSGARLLLPPKGCPAKFRWQQDHPDEQEPKDEFDLGHTVHRLVLGAGAELVEIDAGDYKTKAAQQAKKAAHAEHKTPVLPHQLDRAQEMALAVYDHPIAGPLFRGGHAEVTLISEDPRTKVMCRARLDYLTGRRDRHGRLILVDYKTARSAEPTSFMKSAVEHGYHQQAPWYIDRAVGCGLADDPTEIVFAFVAQEKVAPYIVTVLELDSLALMWGRLLNDKALDLYRHCTTTNQWPGYVHKETPTGFEIPVANGRLPGWAERLAEETTS